MFKEFPLDFPFILLGPLKKPWQRFVLWETTPEPNVAISGEYFLGRATEWFYTNWKVTSVDINLQSLKDASARYTSQKYTLESEVWKLLLIAFRKYITSYGLLQRSRDTTAVEIWKCDKPTYWFSNLEMLTYLKMSFKFSQLDQIGSP